MKNQGLALSSGSGKMSWSSKGHTEIIKRGNFGWQVPRLYKGIVGFDQPLETLKAKVLADIDIDDDGNSMECDGGFINSSVVVVCGMGGCGKTTLVKMLCHDPQIQDIYGENIFYVTVSETPNYMVIVNNLVNPYSYGRNVPFESNEDARNTLEKFLCEKVSGPRLVVLDDVWSESSIKFFAFKIRGYKVVVTSRMLFSEYDMFRLGPLSDEDAKTLFLSSAFTEGGSRRPGPTVDEDLVNQMVKHCNKHPFTLSALGSSLRGKDELIMRSMLRKLSQGRSVLDLNEEILFSLERSFEALDDELKECFLDFGLFPKDKRIPAGAFLDMWVHMYDYDNDGNKTHAKIVELSYKNLVNIMANR